MMGDDRTLAPMALDTILPPRPLGRMSEGRASKLRPGSALVGPRFSLMDLSTSPTETTMQTTPQTPLHLTPGAILASPQGRGTITSSKESTVNLIKSIEQRCCGSMRVPGYGMVYTIDIDRSLAESMVSSTHRNQRRTRPHAIARLVAEMSEGRWMWNGSTIAVSADGQLVDGQHRMRAVALSGVTMRSALVVVREDHLSPLEIVTDVGTARTAIDFRSEKMGNSLAAGILYEYVGMPLNGTWIAAYSQHQRAVIQDACPFVDGLRAIDAAFQQHRGKRLPAGMIAGVISCMRADYELALEYFLGAANNSVIRGVPNEYAAKYGAYVASGLDRDGQSPHKAAGCTVKCWNAFVSDQPVKHLRHRQDEAVPAPLRPRGMKP